jgi:hypothetical protein
MLLVQLSLMGVILAAVLGSGRLAAVCLTAATIFGIMTTK